MPKHYHTARQFKTFLSQLLDTNVTLADLCDFDKIIANVDAIKMHLNQLDYLIGQQDIEKAVNALWNNNPKCFTVLNILVAVRDNDKKVMGQDHKISKLSDYFNSPQQVTTFIKETGLGDLFINQRISNLVDYVFGVETGLDTNARKNRGGHSMERIITQRFNANGIPFKTEVSSTDYDALNVLGTDKKRFDFVVETRTSKYLIEVNFYSSSGSKPNEVARAYTELAHKIENVEGFEFVWITDGIGWEKSRNKIQEAFYSIKNIYNLTSLDQFIEQLKSEGLIAIDK